MSEFTSGPRSFEGSPVITGEQMAALFEAIDSYNDNFSTFQNAISGLTLDTQADGTDYGLLRRLDDIEEEAGEGHSLGRETLHLLHGETLRESGLAFYSYDYLIVRLINGRVFAQTLAGMPVEPETHPRLRHHLGAWLDDWLLLTCNTTIKDNGERAVQLANTLTNWVAIDPDEHAQDRHSVDQLLRHGPALAPALKKLGLDRRADELRRVAAFAADSDLLPWAIASHYGLLPETAPQKDPTLGKWTYWSEYTRWTPVFRLLKAANPVGAFAAYLKQCALAGVDSRMADCRRMLAQNLVQYTDSHQAVDELFGITSGPEIVRQSYARNQRSAQLLIGQLTRVRCELQNFPA